MIELSFAYREIRPPPPLWLFKWVGVLFGREELLDPFDCIGGSTTPLWIVPNFHLLLKPLLAALLLIRVEDCALILLLLADEVDMFASPWFNDPIMLTSIEEVFKFI